MLRETPILPASARQIENRALVEEFLLATERMPQEEAARIAGVGVATLRRWGCTGIKHLNGPTRQRLHMHLAQRAMEKR